MKNKNDITKILRVKFQTELKAVKEEGVIEAYVSIFGNVDSDGDIILRGAFLESLAKKLPKGVWSHNWDEPIASTLEAREDEKGLFIKGQFVLAVQKAKEAFELIKAGVIDEFSIGFRILDWEYDDTGHRVIKKVKLYEWSPVLAGANPDTELVAIKGLKDFKYNLKKEGEDEPEGTPHIITEQDLEAQPELAEAGVKVGDTIYIPDEDEEVSEQSPAPIDETTPPTETPENIEENEQGSGEEGGEGESQDPAPTPEPEPTPDTEELGKSLKEFSQNLNNLVVALTPLAEKIEKSLEGLGIKVNAEPANTLKVLRLRQATKQIDKNAETILRILKN